MKTEVLEKSKMYKVFNDIALKDEIVIFGSSYAARFPFYELSQKYDLNNAVYNRSVEGLTLTEATEVLNDCVLAVKPSKIFLALGECDASESEALTAYSSILQKIREVLPGTKVYALSAYGEENAKSAFNAGLRELCIKSNVEYVNVDYEMPCSTIYKQLSRFFRKGRLDFYDAFQMAE